MKDIKIDFEKIDELEKNPKKVEDIVWYWANKAVDDPTLSWDNAMDLVCKELGINKAEFATLIYGNERFKDLAIVMGHLETRKILSTPEGEIIFRE